MATAKMNSLEKAEKLFDRSRAAEHAKQKTSQYQALLAQRAELDAKIAAARKAEIAQVLAQIQQIVDEYDLHEEVKFTRGRRGEPHGSSAGVKRGRVAARYRDPDSGATWSGRGKPPAWIVGKDRTEFLID